MFIIADKVTKRHTPPHPDFMLVCRALFSHTEDPRYIIVDVQNGKDVTPIKAEFERMDESNLET